MSSQDFYDDDHPVFDFDTNLYFESLYEIEMQQFRNNKSPSSGSIMEEPDISPAELNLDTMVFVPGEVNMDLIDTRPTITVGIFGRIEISYDDFLV